MSKPRWRLKDYLLGVATSFLIGQVFHPAHTPQEMLQDSCIAAGGYVLLYLLIAP